MYGRYADETAKLTLLSQGIPRIELGGVELEPHRDSSRASAIACRNILTKEQSTQASVSIENISSCIAKKPMYATVCHPQTRYANESTLEQPTETP